MYMSVCVRMYLRAITLLIQKKDGAQLESSRGFYNFYDTCKSDKV